MSSSPGLRSLYVYFSIAAWHSATPTDKDISQARTCVAVHQLPLGTDVEIECTAFVN
jgi:enamine deaminase RidA (YjgF/YER057c/UK114 family)